MRLDSDTFAKYIGVIPLLIAVLIYAVGDYFIRRQTEPVAKEKFAALWREIGPHPSFVPVGDCQTIGKQVYALFFTCGFSSAAEYARVSNYYMEKMTSLNWKKTKETNNLLWGVDRGGHTIYFCNDESQLSIDFSNKSANWDYSITLKQGCSSLNS